MYGPKWACIEPDMNYIGIDSVRKIQKGVRYADTLHHTRVL